MRTPSRTGFTLFQLLVVLAILAILFALLLPAIAKVRSAAARSQSQNNLKQIALACHNYHDTNGRFCPGMTDKGYSALALLLPYIEQNNLYQLIKFEKPIDDPANAAPRAALIKTYISPMDPVVQPDPKFGSTNYMFNAGSQPSLKKNNGIFFEGSGIKLAEIPDGTSNTILTAETLKGDGNVNGRDVRRQHVRLTAAALDGLKEGAGVDDFKAGKNIAANRGASWMDGHFLQTTFTATLAFDDSKPDVDCGGMGGFSALRSVEPVHVFGMCDGSVRASQRIPLETWINLCRRNDGNVIGDF